MIWGLPGPIQIEIFKSTNGGVSLHRLAIGDIFYLSNGVRQIGNSLYTEISKYGFTTANRRVLTYEPKAGIRWFVKLNKDREVSYYSTERENGRLTVGQFRRESLQDIRETSAAAPKKGYKDLSDNQLQQLAEIGDAEAAAELEKRRGKDTGRPDSQAPAGAGPLPPVGPGLNLIPPTLPDWDFKNLLIAGLIFLVALGAVVTDK